MGGVIRGVSGDGKRNKERAFAAATEQGTSVAQQVSKAYYHGPSKWGFFEGRQRHHDFLPTGSSLEVGEPLFQEAGRTGGWVGAVSIEGPESKSTEEGVDLRIGGGVGQREKKRSGSVNQM